MNETTAPAPEAVPHVTAPPSITEIEILPGIKVPVAAVAANFDHNCTVCKQGVATLVQGGQRLAAVCACAVARTRRKIQMERDRARAAQPRDPEAPDVTERRLASARNAIGRLQDELDEAESDLAQRESDHRWAIADRLVEAEEAAAKVKGLRRTAEHHQGMANALVARIAAMEGELRSLRGQVGDAGERRRACLDEAERIERNAVATQVNVDAEREAFDRSTAKLRARIEKLRRRITTRKAYNPGAIPLPQETPATAAP